MLISDIVRSKGSTVVKIHTADNVALVVRSMVEHRIGALVVEDRWIIKPVGIFTERDSIDEIARDGAAVLGLDAQQLMSTPIVSCRTSDRVDVVLATMTTGRMGLIIAAPRLTFSPQVPRSCAPA